MARLVLILSLMAWAGRAAAIDYYWVGGTGNWNDLSHWVTASGGIIQQTIVPSTLDNVIFDANSFTAAGQNVTLNQEAFCKDFTWNGVTNTPTFTGAGFNLNVAGNFTVQGGVFTFNHANGNLLISGNLLVDGVNMSFTKSGGTFTVTGNFTLQNNAMTFSRTGAGLSVGGHMILQNMTAGTSFTLASSLSVGGNMSIQNVTPATFNVSGVATTVTGNFLMDNAPLNFNLGNVAMTVNGNFSILNGASTFTHSNVLTVKKSFTLSATVTFNQTNRVDFTAVTTGETITSAGKSFTNARFNGSGGEWVLQDNFKATGTTEHFTGIFRSNGKSVDYGQYFNAVDNGPSVRLTTPAPTRCGCSISSGSAAT